MKAFDGFKNFKQKSANKELEFAAFVTELWDSTDEAEAQDAAHSAIAMLISLADYWNPYWVMGLLQTAQMHIYKNMEEADE